MPDQCVAGMGVTLHTKDQIAPNTVVIGTKPQARFVASSHLPVRMFTSGLRSRQTLLAFLP